jgi:hypothetical protein
MGLVTVPERHRRALSRLRDLPRPEADAFIAWIDELPSFLSVEQLGKRLRERLPSSLHEEADALLSALLTLRVQIRQLEWKVSKLAEAVSRAEGLAPPTPVGQRELKRRLQALLSADAILTTASAADLLFQHDRPFRSARIVSDIRPVFTDNAAESPRGAVIIQMLQITAWSSGGGTETLSFALDEKDLLTLKRVVDRGIKKTKTLRDCLDEGRIARFEPEADA